MESPIRIVLMMFSRKIMNVPRRRKLPISEELSKRLMSLFHKTVTNPA